MKASCFWWPLLKGIQKKKKKEQSTRLIAANQIAKIVLICPSNETTSVQQLQLDWSYLVKKSIIILQDPSVLWPKRQTECRCGRIHHPSIFKVPEEALISIIPPGMQHCSDRLQWFTFGFPWHNSSQSTGQGTNVRFWRLLSLSVPITHSKLGKQR